MTLSLAKLVSDENALKLTSEFLGRKAMLGSCDLATRQLLSDFDHRQLMRSPGTCRYLWHDQKYTEMTGPAGSLPAGVPETATRVFNSVEQLGGVFRKLADGLRQDLEPLSYLGVHIFLTPIGGGVEWHYDMYDLLIIPLVGNKVWRYGEHAVNPTPTFNYIPSLHGAVRIEEGSFLTRTLSPGDFLYLPAGCWHSTSATGAAVSLSVTFARLPTVMTTSGTEGTSHAAR